MNEIYIDNAATTKVRQEVLDVMAECNEHYANPSCIHAMGQKSRELIENARKKVADSINAEPDEIIFTSGGTESNNLAIQGFVSAHRGRHIITTSIEHMSVFNPVKYLYNYEGYDVTYLPVDRESIINLRQLERSIRKDTMLISIMYANNETGSIQPIREIGEIAKQYNICFHVDAVQAFGHIPINVKDINIDMLSVSGHKIYAPKGVGFLYVKNDIKLNPLFFGGRHEYGLRSGTENVNSIVGLGKAVELLHEENKIKDLKTKLIEGIKSTISNVKFNGSVENSLSNIVNVSFEEINGEELIMLLSSHGIYASNSAACLYSRSKPSYVLKAIGVPDDLVYGSVRFSLGRYNTEDEIDYILNILPELVNQLRK